MKSQSSPRDSWLGTRDRIAEVRARSNERTSSPERTSPYRFSASSRMSGWKRPAASATAPASMGASGEETTTPGGIGPSDLGMASPGSFGVVAPSADQEAPTVATARA